MYLKRLSVDKAAVCVGGKGREGRRKADNEACRNGQHEFQLSSFDRNIHY